MILSKLSARRTPRLAAALIAAVSLASAADDAAPSVPVVQTSSQSDEITRLKAQLAAQQKQLETLQRMMERQQQLLEKAVNAPAAGEPVLNQPTPRPNLGSIASLTPVIPAPAAARAWRGVTGPSLAVTLIVARPCDTGSHPVGRSPRGRGCGGV